MGCRIAATPAGLSRSPQCIFFCGDLDPPGLLIYAWLRSLLQPAPVVFLGAGCRLVDALTEFRRKLCLTLSAPERSALPLVRRCLPDLAELAGEAAPPLLKRKLKIELEALLSHGLETGRPLGPRILELLQR